MNTLKFLLYNGTQFVDISDIVETNANIQDKLDLTLDFATINIPHAKATYEKYPNIDFSKPIKPWTPFVLEINNIETFRFYTTDCSRTIIGKGSDKRYKHEINLVEASKSLFGKPIPDMTITQPKSAIFQGTYFSDLKSENVEVNNTETNLNLELVNNSSNTSFIDGNIIKAGNTANIYLNVALTNYQYKSDKGRPFVDDYTRSSDAEIIIYGYANGIKVYESLPLYIDGGTSVIKGFYPFTYLQLDKEATAIYNLNFIRTNVSTDETITFKAKTVGEYVKCNEFDGCSTFEDELEVTLRATISSDKDEQEYPYKTIVGEVKKILEVVNSQYGTSYYLNSNTEFHPSLVGVLAPEYTFQSYTAWDALEKLANYVNAIPEIGVENFSEISFTFLDEEPDIEYSIEQFTDETQGYLFDDYNAGYELNATNTIEEDVLGNVKVEPYIGGWMTVRTNSEEVTKMQETNAAFRTRQPIYKIYKMSIKGPIVRIVSDTQPDKLLYGNVKFDDNGNPISAETSSSYWDLTDLTVESQRWNTFENGTQNGSDSQRLNHDTKGNHISYTQGTKFIKDLSYKTDTISDIFGTTIAPRSLMETILRAAAQHIQSDSTLLSNGYKVKQPTSLLDGNPEAAFESDHKLFTGVFAQVQYIPFSNVRSTIYKHNAFDLGVDTVKYSNEQDKINDTKNLGEQAKKTINKLGNIIYTVSGIAKEYETIPKLGYKTTDGKYISSRSINLNKNLITYDMELSENFLNQSSYVGVDSAYRQYEVPATDIVHRQDKYQEFILLTTNKTPLLPTESYLTTYGKRAVLTNFQEFNSSYNRYPISYGKMTITKELGSVETDNIKSFDMPINGYAVGNTINLQLEMEDNYSAGPRLDSDVLGPVDDIFKHQNYARYTDQLGSFYSFDLQLRQSGTVNNTETDANNYPFLTQESSGGYYDEPLFNLIRTNVNKDAREKYGLNIQFPVLSTESSIRIHPGFAKYAGLIRNRSNKQLGFGILQYGYMPSINDTELNTTKTTILTTTDFNTNVEWDSTNLIYGLNYKDVKVVGGTKIQGYVVFEATTNELILSVNHPVDRTGLGTTNYDFPTIWAVHKRNLNTRMYPDNPIRYTVTFNEMSGTDVQDQLIFSGNLASEPSISREGYELDGWFTHVSFLEQYRFDFSTPITSNITLYAKWTALPVGQHIWERVYTSTYDVQIFPEILSYECPTDYIPLLPDPDLYQVGYTAYVMPYRLCNSTTETCYQNPITMADFQTCEVRYYRVVEE